MDAHERSVALMKHLAAVAVQSGVGDHVYIVGGAVRNFLMGSKIKDIDIVIDTVGAGKDSEWFADQVRKSVSSNVPGNTNLTTNQYGVAILTVREWKIDGAFVGRQVIEIANARRESYGAPEGKGYKPHLVERCTIQEDLLRREFTFNTLLWRMADLVDGPEKAEVLDLTGQGRSDLEGRVIHTPSPPDKTFSDDPTRMLRAVKFVARYGFRTSVDVFASILRNASKLRQMPWEAVRKILVEDILEGPNPRQSVVFMQSLGLTPVLKTWLDEEQGFRTALGRALNEADPDLILDLYDLDWTMSTPISFLTKEGRQRLREIIKDMDPNVAYGFVQSLQRPPVDQPALFEKYKLQGKDRGRVLHVAREALLQGPSEANRLHDVVDVLLSGSPDALKYVST